MTSNCHAGFSLGLISDYFKIQSTENVGGNETSALSMFSPGLSATWSTRLTASSQFFVDLGLEHYSMQALTTGQSFSQSSGWMKRYGIGMRKIFSHRFRAEVSVHSNEDLFVHVVSPSVISIDSQMIMTPTLALQYQAFDFIHIGTGVFAEYGLRLSSSDVQSGNHVLGGLSFRLASKEGFSRGPEIQVYGQLDHQNTLTTTQSDERVGLKLIYHWRSGS